MRVIALRQQTEGMSSLPITLPSLSDAFVDLVSRTAPGVVAVKAAPYRVVSGVALTDGIVAVSGHTLRHNGRVAVQQSDGTRSEANVVGREPRLDIAFLKLENSLSVLPIAQSYSLKTGSLIAVVGMTMDVGPSVSFGTLGAVGGARRTWRGGNLDHFFRLDVNLYPSQSGAAVVDAEGKLIGLATAGILRHSAVAIPFVTINRFAEELLREGRIRYGYLGVGMQPVPVPSVLRDKLPSAPASALIMLSVEPDSPAEKAGLQVSDILISLDGKFTPDVDDLQAILQGTLIGRTVNAIILRGGNVMDLEVTIMERPQKGKA